MASKWLIAAEAALAERFPSQDRAKSVKTAKSHPEEGVEGTFGSNGTFGTPGETTASADRLPEENPQNAFFWSTTANGAINPHPPASPVAPPCTDAEDRC